MGMLMCGCADVWVCTVLTRPRKSASWLAPHTTALDRAPMQEDGVANVLENPYFQPEEVTQFPLSWVKSQSAASSAAHKATPLAPLGMTRVVVVSLPICAVHYCVTFGG